MNDRAGTGPSRSNRGVSLRIEDLEDRRLLAGAIADLGVLPPSTTLSGPMAVSSLGKLWFAEGGDSGANKLGVLSSRGGIEQVDLPSTDVGGSIKGLTADGNGNIWYSYSGESSPGGATSPGLVNRVGKVAGDGTISEYPLPNTLDHPGAITLGPDGNVWIAVANDANGPSIDRIDASGKVTAFAVTGVRQVLGLTAGPENDLWFASGDKIAKMTMAGIVTEYQVPSSTTGSPVDLSNAQLASGADGNLWFLGLGGLSKITPSGVVTTLPAPGSRITSLTSANDGGLWITYFPPSTSSQASTPGEVVARIDPGTGRTTILPDRIDATGTAALGSTSDHFSGVWLNEGGAKVGRVNLAGIAAFTPPIALPTTSTGLQTDASRTFMGTVISFIGNSASGSNARYSASIDWGDGHSTTGTVAANTSGGYDVSGTYTYGSNIPPGNALRITVNVFDGTGASAQVFNRIIVGSAPISIPINPVATPAPGAGVPTASQSPIRVRRMPRAHAHAVAHAHVSRPVHPRGPAVHMVRNRQVALPIASRGNTRAA